ncbi:MAG: integrase family protein [Oscillospiraceae bacterium]|nr:integrase family protein [Oscillospiraceae bacterium]
MRGSIKKRNGAYCVVYDAGKYADGKRRQKWKSGFKTKKDAEKALRTLIEEEENSFVKKQEHCTLGVYLNEWLISYCEGRLARNTINGYRVNIEKHIIPHIGQIPLCDLQPEQIERLYVQLQSEGLAGTSVLYVHRVLRKALNTAVKSRKLRVNVTDYVEAPAKSKFRPSVLRQDEVLKLLAQVKDTEIFIPVLFAVTLGMRRGESLGMKWSDIDFQQGTLQIQRTATTYKDGVVYSDVKTANSHRTLCIPQHVMIYLLEHKEHQRLQGELIGEGFNADGLVTCRADGCPLTSHILDKAFKRSLKAAELPNIRFHDLRHTNATLMLSKNVPAKIVSSMLGHSSIGITLDTYSHVITEMQQPAINVIEQLFSDNVSKP